MKKTTKTREELVAKITELMEKDGLNWIAGWTYDDAINGNGRKYNGVNKFLLNLTRHCEGYNDNRWYTFKQIKEGGYKLKDAKNKGVPVEWWFMSYHDEKNDKWIALDWKEYEKMPNEEKEKCVMSAKTYIVFNGDLVEGLKPARKIKNAKVAVSTLVKTISAKMGVAIINDGGSQAFYKPSEDKIHLPKVKDFKSSYEYNSTALHELAHATGHKSRLDRNIKNAFGSENYAFEELVAELTSVFMSRWFKGQKTERLENHAAYLKNWKDAIKKDSKCLFKAIKLAEQSADYMEKMAGLI